MKTILSFLLSFNSSNFREELHIDILSPQGQKQMNSFLHASCWVNQSWAGSC